jgi:hypothetical protein
MNYRTEKIVEELGLTECSTAEMVEGVLDKISRLERWKFAVGIHTLYVDAVADLTARDEATILLAKKTCNDRAFREPYQL